MRALVTGANGFLGRHVVSALQARGIDVRALVRPAAQLEQLGWPSSVEIFRGDLRTSRDLAAAFDGIDVVLHLAAVVSGGDDAQFAGTVAGTERLLEAMATSSCRRLILCSSFSVYDYGATLGTLDETSPIPGYLTRPANYLGLCSLAMPSGQSSGLPVGIQIVGKPFAERDVLRLGKAFQDATDFHRRAPDLSALGL